MNWREISTSYKDRAEILRTQRPHEVLQVSETATLDEVKGAYRRLVKIYHPDKSDSFVQTSNAEILKIVINAYEEMSLQAQSKK
jgi:DnaJ-class molecular chaperone